MSLARFADALTTPPPRPPLLPPSPPQLLPPSPHTASPPLAWSFPWPLFVLLSSSLLVSARTTYVGLVLVLGLVGVALWALAARWVYLDARRREADPRPWLTVAIVLGFVGVIVWLLVRDNVAPLPEPKPQPRPAAEPEARYGTAVCNRCGALVPFGMAEAARTWMACPKCGNKVTV